MLALVFGVVARSAAAGNFGVQATEQTVGRLGGHPAGPAAAWIGYEFVFIAALVAFAAATQISGVRGEEADGHLDHLLARPVSRSTWLAGRLGFGVVLVLAAGLAAGLGGWIGVATTRHGGIGFGAMMQAGLNVALPALFFLGLGTMLYGLAPRLAAPVLCLLGELLLLQARWEESRSGLNARRGRRPENLLSPGRSGNAQGTAGSYLRAQLASQLATCTWRSDTHGAFHQRHRTGLRG